MCAYPYRCIEGAAATVSSQEGCSSTFVVTWVIHKSCALQRLQISVVCQFVTLLREWSSLVGSLIHYVITHIPVRDYFTIRTLFCFFFCCSESSVNVGVNAKFLRKFSWITRKKLNFQLIICEINLVFTESPFLGVPSSPTILGFPTEISTFSMFHKFSWLV